MARGATAIDAYVGERLRLRRTLLGISQTELAEVLGVTFQQIQKYERGSNRIGAGNLYKIARALRVPVSYFFEDLPDDLDEDNPPPATARFDQLLGGRQLNRRETLTLIRHFHAIRDPQVRAEILDLIKRLGDDGGEV
ncbi:MAG: hypothetical protein KatS3mg119_1499 [Rhodothalassiaceae bacterium]|nr:MAG: hypothetical protein KatS3mg119_1499 [Rhodothalassiaceae bacterium]